MICLIIWKWWVMVSLSFHNTIDLYETSVCGALDWNRRYSLLGLTWRVPGGSDGKEPSCHAGFDPWVGKIPWSRAWKSTPLFLPVKSYGQRNLAGYSPCSHSWATNTFTFRIAILAIYSESHHVCICPSLLPTGDV